MSDQPFYHLRTNKYIDRQLFTNTLNDLSRYLPISEYTYIGFGSFMFDDFKLLHQKLDIKKMISLEQDGNIYHRAERNKPYSCIEVQNRSSTEFISTYFPTDENVVLWLDYTSPKDIATQFSDIVTLLPNLNPHDIIRVTLNANPRALYQGYDSEKAHTKRLSQLKKRIPDFISETVTAEQMTIENFPIVLLNALKKAAQMILPQTSFNMTYLFPISSTVYNDGTQMVLLTAIVLDNLEDEDKVRGALKNNTQASFAWDQPVLINVPMLTEKEAIEIDQLLPSENALSILRSEFSYLFTGINDDGSRDLLLESYLNYYKYYPHFHSVNF